MRSMSYTADTQKIRGRFVPCVQGAVLAAVFAMVGLTLREVAPKENFHATVLMISLVVFMASIATMVWFSRHLPAAKNLLSLDRSGLSLMRRGRTRRWRWADISPIRLDGKSATFTAETGQGRSEERILDIYPTPLVEIAARINDYREQAPTAAETASDAESLETGPTAPTIYYLDAAARNRQRRKEFAGFAAAMILLPILYFSLSHGQDTAVLKALESIETALGLMFGFLMVLTLVLLFFITGKSGNFIQVTGEGLTWGRRLTMIRQWKWQDISSFEVRDKGKGKSSGGRAIAFMAADDGKLFQGMGASSLLLARTAPGLQSFVLDDTYDAPLERIAEELNAHRDRALADTPPDRLIELPMEGAIGADGQLLNFQQEVRGLERLGVVGWALAFGCVVWLPVLLLLGYPFEIDDGMQGWARSPGQWLQRFAFMLVPIVIIAEMLFLTREIMPADNALTLDKYGMTLTRGGRKKVWAWRDLSDFAVDARKVLGLFGPRGVVVFEAPGGRDLRSRFLRWCYRLTGHAPAFVIEDVYNTPIDDIAAVLNSYRAEGAGGGATA